MEQIAICFIPIFQKDNNQNHQNGHMNHHHHPELNSPRRLAASRGHHPELCRLVQGGGGDLDVLGWTFHPDTGMLPTNGD